MADAVDDEAEVSLAFDFGKCSAIIGRGGVDDKDCIGGFVVEYALMWATAVDFLEFFSSFVFSQQLFSSVVVCAFFDDSGLYASWPKMSHDMQGHGL